MENSSAPSSGNVDATNPAQETLPRSYAVVITFICLYVPLALIIIAGNILVIVVFKNNKKLKVPINVLFMSLASSDFLVGAVSIPLWIYNLSCPHLKSCSVSLDLLRRFFQPFDIFSALASTTSLAFISLERYFAISCPIRHRNCSPNFYYVLIFTTWLYAFSIAVIYSCMFTPHFTQLRALLVFLAGFIMPLVIITIMYTCTYLSVRSLRLRRNQDLATTLRTNNVKKERKTARTVGIVTCLFVIAWLPFFVVSMLYTFCQSCLPSPRVLVHLIDFVKWMQYSNSAVNPFVYAYRSVEVRRSVLRLLLAPFHKCAGGRFDLRTGVRHFPKNEDGLPREQGGRVRAELRKTTCQLLELQEMPQVRVPRPWKEDNHDNPNNLKISKKPVEDDEKLRV